MSSRVLVLALLLQGCMVRAGGGDDDDDSGLPRGGEGEGEGGDTYDQFNDLCWEAGDWVRQNGCQSDSSHCATEEALHRASGGVCLEYDVAWYDCILASPFLECDHDCDFETPVACKESYCADHPETEGCFGPAPTP